jgi:hypothetical protein
LRAYAKVTTWRICAKEFSIGRITMKPGDRVAMATPLAARDPEERESPGEVLEILSSARRPCLSSRIE